MLINLAEFNTYELSVLFGEQNLHNFTENTFCKGVSTDTRTLVEGNCFIALKGDNTDGHARIKEAFEKGASFVISEKEWFSENKNEFSTKPIITVNNTLKALGQLGNYHRNRFNCQIIAVGGSNGKTTTKDIIAYVLSGKFNILKTAENYNNQIGVPLTLLQLNENIDIAVIEIGTNEPGEISILSSIVQPTHGLITNIGREHLEKLIDLDGVELEETFLFGHLKKHNGFAFVNFDDQRLKKYSNFLDKRVTYGTDSNADINAEIQLDSMLHPIINFKYNSKSIEIKLKTIGYGTAYSAIAAFAVANHFELSEEMIKQQLESFYHTTEHIYGRMLLEKITDFTLINDCYNANPDSMALSLKVLESYKNTGKKYAILGDMLELGVSSKDEHIQVLKTASEVADLVLAYGSEMLSAKNELELKNIQHFEEKNELFDFLLNLISTDDVLLVKGSRGMKMEEIIKKLKDYVK
ncbi:MAG: UDP-N-acetylmuramoyl-tripeptide--D-alanyl-D-alanine ligase [Candidatus Kapabacteria bacterium]|nr:UDP-N-acetylmuramoyl-tripeptide--D-alanyl-D-alanine ligase [Candidatus Kapabacteria bacterium]